MLGDESNASWLWKKNKSCAHNLKKTALAAFQGGKEVVFAFWPFLWIWLTEMCLWNKKPGVHYPNLGVALLTPAPAAALKFDPVPITVMKYLPGNLSGGLATLKTQRNGKYFVVYSQWDKKGKSVLARPGRSARAAGAVVWLTHSTCELLLLKMLLFFCSFHLQLKLSNMHAALCCRSKDCFLRRRAPPPCEKQLYFRVICGLSHSASELERPPVNQLEVQPFLREGQWRNSIATQSQAATSPTVPRVALIITQSQTLKLCLFLVLETIDHQMRGFKGKLWLQPGSVCILFDGLQALLIIISHRSRHIKGR